MYYKSAWCFNLSNCLLLRYVKFSVFCIIILLQHFPLSFYTSFLYHVALCINYDKFINEYKIIVVMKTMQYFLVILYSLTLQNDDVKKNDVCR